MHRMQSIPVPAPLLLSSQFVLLLLLLLRITHDNNDCGCCCYCCYGKKQLPLSNRRTKSNRKITRTTTNPSLTTHSAASPSLGSINSEAAKASVTGTGSSSADDDGDDGDDYDGSDVSLNGTKNGSRRRSWIQLVETEVYDGTTWRAPGAVTRKTTSTTCHQFSSSSSSSSLRWTDLETGNPAPSPLDYSSDNMNEYDWTSEWKILTSPHRDEFGWEYVYNKHGFVSVGTAAGLLLSSTAKKKRKRRRNRNDDSSSLLTLPTRRRIWLRSFHEEEDDYVAKGSSSSTVLPSSSSSSSGLRIRNSKRRKGKRRSRSSSISSLLQRLPGPIRHAFQLVREDFNFKGFGITLYKSLVFHKSAGIAIRMPILTNWNVWESHPSLPSLGTSLAFFAPGSTVVFFLNASARYEWLQWLVSNTTRTIVFVSAWLLWTLLLRGLITAVSALAYPVTRRLYVNPPFPTAFIPPPQWQNQPPRYSRDYEERLGCSWSWRVNLLQPPHSQPQPLLSLPFLPPSSWMQWLWQLRRKCEYRVSYWHYIAPSFSSMSGRGRGSSSSSDGGRSGSRTTRSISSSSSSSSSSFGGSGAFLSGISGFCVRHAAAIGLTTTGPIPEAPYLTSSVLLAMSGFRFRSRRSTATMIIQPPPTSPTTTNTTATTIITTFKNSTDSSGSFSRPPSPPRAARNAVDLIRLVQE